MKSTTKKMFAFLLSVIMVLAMTVTAFAADGNSNDSKAKLTINNTTEATYTAYKVMNVNKAGQDNDGNTIYSYTVCPDFNEFFAIGQDGKGINGYTLNKDNEILDADGNKVRSDGTANNTNATEAAKLASLLEKYALEKKLAGENIPTEGASLDKGYYVVAETATTSNTVVASKPILVNLLSDVSIKPKNSNIDLEKKIVEGDQRLDANTANIGDVIHYEVRTAIPTYEANVDVNKLSYVLTDTFTNLTYKKDAVIEANGTALVKNTDYTINEADDNFVLSLKPETIKDHQGENIVLTYSATLNKNAVVDNPAGNPNHIKLEYTNNPNVDNSKGTLNDEVKTYTFGLKIHKVDKNDDTKDMAGAAFEVKNADGTVIGTFEYGADGQITKPTGLIITKDGNVATIKGLKDGEYTITEKKAPAGYSVLSTPVVVEIKDKGKESGGEANGEGKLSIVSGQGTAECDVENHDGIIDLMVKIENVKGISLPETGAKTAMYCLFGGAALIVLGGFYFGLEKLFSRKRQ